MNRVAYRHSYSISHRQSHAWALLVQLSSAHDQLALEIENLDRITHGAALDRREVSTGRWRISQASLKRRSLACRTFNFLAERLAGVDLATLKAAQSADQEMMRRSASHVGNWALKTIFNDWQGYCAASRQIRAHMKAHIEMERQTLYPMLERLAEQGI